MRQINNFLKTFDMGFYLWHGFCIIDEIIKHQYTYAKR